LGSAKDIVLRPIDAPAANALVKRVHYSGKVVNNSQLHIGVFYQGRLEGAMQFGPSLDKRKMLGLVTSTGWNEFLELNRMAFSDVLPRNSESRAIGIAMRMLRKHAPQVQWVVSFADATQCGDGTIYRAAGFVLTGVRANTTLVRRPDGSIGSELTGGRHLGGTPLNGYQLRYVYFIDPTARERLTVPIIPFSEIERRGAGMYRGIPRAASIVADAPAVQAGEQGAAPMAALHTSLVTHD
jgi:hypothetical protein